MGKDYRHKKKKFQQFEDLEDGFEKNHKLDKYDRNKNRRQNKFNIQHDDVTVERVDEDNYSGVDNGDVTDEFEAYEYQRQLNTTIIAGTVISNVIRGIK